MKTKKILSGGFILVLAIGSAIASSFTPEQAHIRGKINIYTDMWACVPIDIESTICDSQGPTECIVNIPLMGVDTNVLAYKGPGVIVPETSCTVPLRRHTSLSINGTPMAPILEVWSVDLRLD